MFARAGEPGKIRDGFLGDNDFPEVMTVAASKLAESQIYIDDTAGLSILELRAKARRFKQMYDIKLIVIDYLQLAAFHQSPRAGQPPVGDRRNFSAA